MYRFIYKMKGIEMKKITIVGIGRLGLCFALVLEKKGIM